MSHQDIKNAFSTLRPRVVGSLNGKRVILWPRFRTFCLLLLANGRTVILNYKQPENCLLDARANKNGNIVCYSEFQSATHQQRQDGGA